MRWFLSGFSFALLVGLAMATVAVKAVNVRSRQRLEELETRLLGRQVEQERYELLLREATSRVVLAERWQEVLEAALRRAAGVS